MEFRGYDKNFGLNGKVALITGGGGGIGRAIATLFYEKGANLILLDLNPNIQTVGQEIAQDLKESRLPSLISPCPIREKKRLPPDWLNSGLSTF